ncbi:MAG TPA: hypothetical protein VF796_18750, partial [Humisphaera sp.]
RYHGDEVLHPERQPAYNRTDADGADLSNGVVRCARTHKGHLVRGPVFYNMNSMWLLVAARDEHPHQLNCGELFTFDPTRHPRKQCRHPRRPVKGVRAAGAEDVTRSVCERYDVTCRAGRVTFFVDERDWRLAVTGAWGEYGHAFGGAAPSSFKRFLAGAGRDYLHDKLERPERRVWLEEKSTEALLARVDEAAEGGSVTRDQARAARAAAKRLHTSDGSHAWAAAVMEDDALSRVLDGDFEGLIVRGPDPQVVGLLEEAWPPFAAALAAELAAAPAPSPDRLTPLELLNLKLSKGLPVAAAGGAA